MSAIVAALPLAAKTTMAASKIFRDTSFLISSFACLLRGIFSYLPDLLLSNLLNQLIRLSQITNEDGLMSANVEFMLSRAKFKTQALISITRRLLTNF
jgi:hypothetical protein